MSSCEATASKIIVGSWQWPVNIPFHVAGQFFHVQCMQSRLPNIPRKPQLSPTSNNLATSLLFGDLKYSLEKIETTALTNL
jgi:hypothetical protein